LRDLFFSFFSRKDAEPQRNTGPPTTGRLTEKEKYPFFAPSLLCELFFFLFFSQRRQDAKEEEVFFGNESPT
jgi:hypothetical protein